MPNELENGSGLTTVPSDFTVKETIDRLSDAAERAGLMIFARIDHGANAAQLGMPLRPTELVLFGNPRGGTPLMQDQQVAGLDLPVRALAWEDESGHVWLTFNDPRWLARRYCLGARNAEIIERIRAGLAALATAATAA